MTQSETVASGTAIVVPRESANDDQAILIAWLKQDGDRVTAGESIVELEYSKATIEVAAGESGVLSISCNPGDEVAIGGLLGYILQSPANTPASANSASPSAQNKVTAKAQQLIEQNGLEPSLFDHIEIVKQKHVQAYLDNQCSSDNQRSAASQPLDEPQHELGEACSLTPVRRRTAKVLSSSNREIPHSHLVRYLDADALESQAATLGQKHQLMLSVSDLLGIHVAQQAAVASHVRRYWSQDNVRQHPDVNLGFALNQPNGDLLLPVIRHADQLDVEGFVGRIRGIQKAAIRQRLTPQDLSGGTITITSLVGSGAHQVNAIVPPGQAVIIALGDRFQLGAHACYTLTIAFDHRVLNGMEAATFLAAVSNALEGKNE